jgi:Xaa-Pro aminopeptidase
MLIREQNLIQEKLQVQMEKSGLDAMILTAPESVYYATGMASMFMYSANRVGIGLAVVPNSRPMPLGIPAKTLILSPSLYGSI